MRIAAYAAALVMCLSSVATAQTSAPSPSPSPAASPTGPDLARTRADTLLRGGHADAAWFSAVFLSQVTPAQVDAIVAQLKTTLGAYTNIDGGQGHYVAHFEKGTDEVLVHLDADGKIDGLFFKPPKQQASSLDDALRRLRPTSGTLSYIVIEGRSERAALDASEPLAVGSAFKLAVLAALRDEIDAGRRHWEEVVPLDARWKSVQPSGVLAAWPDGLPLTVATYAAQMISISDNTAADALVRLAGPPALAPYARRNAPFLTTREVFTLKSTPAATLRAAFLAAPTPAQRAEVLRAVDALPLPTADAQEKQPDLAIEWHYSVRDLCGLMNRVADLPLMTINPGVADRSDFRRVAYKGGSDLGAINLTTRATTKTGTTFCFSATLNDPAAAVADTDFEDAYRTVLTVLAGR